MVHLAWFSPLSTTVLLCFSPNFLKISIYFVQLSSLICFFVFNASLVLVTPLWLNPNTYHLKYDEEPKEVGAIPSYLKILLLCYLKNTLGDSVVTSSLMKKNKRNKITRWWRISGKLYGGLDQWRRKKKEKHEQKGRRTWFYGLLRLSLFFQVRNS